MTRKNSAARITRVLLAGAATLIGGWLLSAGVATSQTVGEVSVVAPHVVHEKAGFGANGMPVEYVSLTRHVGYGDLDLNRPADRETFKTRVRDTARQACAQIDTLYPLGLGPQDPGNANCAREAIRGALAQVNLTNGPATGKQ